MASHSHPDYLPGRRLFACEWEALSSLELLALLVGPGVSEKKAFEQARNLLDAFGSLPGLQQACYQDLRLAGLRERQALAVLAARQIAARSNRNELEPGQRFGSSLEVVRYFKPEAENLKRECFWVVMLDGKNRLIKLERISQGSLTSSLVHPREVFRPAIREASAGVLFVHNHPSGDPTPSQEDLEITRRLVETGKIVGIRVLDHVIIGAFRYFSFADQGLL